MLKFIPQGMGWIPDLPDPRDYTYRHQEILPILQQLEPSSDELPDEVDLRYGDEGEVYFTDVEDQGPLNSSTAFAVLSLVEYFERRLHGRTFDGAKLFLYKVTRNLRNRQARIAGDTGADLRTTLRALRRFGTPDEAYLPYDPTRFDEEPGAFAFQSAHRFDDCRYFRIDPSPNRADNNWEALASFVASGFPVAFGFSVPSSLSTASLIPYRPQLDDFRGGQAAVVTGYRLNHFGRNQHAFRIRSSWGSLWGEDGNGWISHRALYALGRDMWSIMSNQWIDTNELNQPSCVHALSSRDAS